MQIYNKIRLSCSIKVKNSQNSKLETELIKNRIQKVSSDVFLKVAALVTDLSSSGKLFHACVLAWEKARSPNFVVWKGYLLF